MIQDPKFHATCWLTMYDFFTKNNFKDGLKIMQNIESRVKDELSKRKDKIERYRKSITRKKNETLIKD